MKVNLLGASILASLLASSLTFAGNGVERGSIRKALKSPEMRISTKDLIESSLRARCSIGEIQKITATTKVRYKTVDRGSVDRFFTVELEVVHSQSRTDSPVAITVEAAEYNISRQVPNGEVLSVDSEICR